MLFNESLANITSSSKSMTLFMAAMGWGKTRSVWSLAEMGEKIVFVSPLRSIVEEQKSRELVYFFTQERSKKEVLDEFIKTKKGAILLVTPESLNSSLKEILFSNELLFVLDEFHLFYEWGNTFRENLMDFYIDILCANKRLLALSASMEEELIETIKDEVLAMGYSIYIIDVGNFKFKFNPKHMFEMRQMPLTILMWFCILLYTRGRILIFLDTRRNVFEFSEKLRQLGIASSYCVGGEVSSFVERENRVKNRVIISTSALSHGVNLRDIRKVFIMYQPKKSVHFQMLGRGGRFGEGFSAYTLFKKCK